MSDTAGRRSTAGGWRWIPDRGDGNGEAWPEEMEMLGALAMAFLFASVSAAWADPFPEAREFYFSALHAAPLTVPDPFPSVYGERRGRVSVSDGRLGTKGSTPYRRERTELG